jgi:hypothetical protein
MTNSLPFGVNPHRPCAVANVLDVVGGIAESLRHEARGVGKLDLRG